MNKQVLWQGTHSHVITENEVKISEDKSKIKAPVAFGLAHEEHETLYFPAGNYNHYGLVEADPLSKEVRDLAD